MPRLEFEPTILEFGRAKTFHALDRAATVIGTPIIWTGYKINHAFTGMGNKRPKAHSCSSSRTLRIVYCVFSGTFMLIYTIFLCRNSEWSLSGNTGTSLVTYLICNLNHYVGASTFLNYMPISFNADSKTIGWKNVQVRHNKRQIIEDPKEILVNAFCVRQTIRTYTDSNASELWLLSGTFSRLFLGDYVKRSV
jgi:hypothetical protein